MSTTLHLDAAGRPIGAAASVAEDKYAHKYLIAIAVTMAAVLELIDTSIVNVAIPHMMGNLGATLDEISWVSTGYIIANVIVIPMSSWLSAYFGRRRYLVGSIMLFVLSSFFCGAAGSLGGLIFWRVVQGFGGGALLSTAQSTLFEAFPPEEVGIGQAMFGIGVMVGPTIGPTLGGFITDNYDWPWIFYINVPLGILAAIMVATYVKDAEHQERATSVDVLGIGLLATCVGSLQWMLERGERYDWFESPFVTALGVISLTTGIGLIWRELTVDEPIIDFSVLRSRQLTTGVAMAAALGLALYGGVFVLPIFLQQLHGFTAQQTGMVILPGAIASALTMAVMGRMRSKVDARWSIAVGAFVFLLAMWKLATMTIDSGQPDLFWPLVLRGVGLGLIFIPLTNASMAELKMKDIAQGTGMFNLMRQLGGSMGIAIMATLLGRYTKSAKAVLSEHVGAIDISTQSRLDMIAHGLVAKGMTVYQAKQQAIMFIDRQLQAQASVLAFSKLYLLNGIVLLCALPLMLLWKTGRGREGMGGSAH